MTIDSAEAKSRQKHLKRATSDSRSEEEERKRKRKSAMKKSKTYSQFQHYYIISCTIHDIDISI